MGDFADHLPSAARPSGVRPIAMETLALLLTALPLTQASTWFVDDDATGPGTGTAADPFPTIQAAIDAPTTAAGDTVVILEGTYPESLVLDGVAIDLVASAGATVTVERFGVAPALRIESVAGQARVEGLDFVEVGTPGAPQPDPMVVVEGADVVFVDTSVQGSRAGGVRVVDGSTARFDVVTISGARAGAGIAGSGTLAGCGLYVNGSSVEVVDSVLSGNRSFGVSGGGAYVGDAPGSRLEVRRTEVSHNAAFRGSGLFAAGELVVEECVIRRNGFANSSQSGGGIQGPALVTRSLIELNNSAFGGGLHGAVQVRDSIIRGNTGSDGAAIGVAVFGLGRQDTELVRCEVSGHAGIQDQPGSGGSPLVSLSLVDCQVADNSMGFSLSGGSAPLGGAGHDCLAVRTLFEGNSTAAPTGFPFGGLGGALVNSTAIDCTFEGNSAPGGDGGATWNCELEGCLLVNNSAQRGGAAAGPGRPIRSCTFVNNDAVTAGGAGFDVDMDSCITAGNTPDGVAGPQSTVTFSNLADAFVPGQGNINADPLFWGPVTGDWRLRPGSPCIGAANPAASRPDMGAFAFDPGYVGAPGAYCSSKLDVVGCIPSLGVDRAPSLSGAPSAVTIQDMPGQRAALLFVGLAPADTPFQGGRLCVGGFLVRSAIFMSSPAAAPCDGLATLSLTGADLVALGFTPGDTLYLQGFYRAGPGPLPDGLGLTNGVELVLVP